MAVSHVKWSLTHRPAKDRIAAAKRVKPPWCAQAQQGIDSVEEMGVPFRAWEFKWNPKAKNRFPAAFSEAYHPESLELVTPENFESFLQL